MLDRYGPFLSFAVLAASIMHAEDLHVTTLGHESPREASKYYVDQALVGFYFSQLQPPFAEACAVDIQSETRKEVREVDPRSIALDA